MLNSFKKSGIIYTPVNINNNVKKVLIGHVNYNFF